MTMDGFVADSHGNLDWMVPETDQKQIELLNTITENIGTIVLGRKMATEAIPHWQNIAENESDKPEVKYARFFVETPKIVFSKTLRNLDGKNVTIENGDVAGKINVLKEKTIKDIIVYGGARFVSSLIENGLVDELNLFVHPVTVGKGLSIFNDKGKFTLSKSDSYSNGIVLMKYKL